MIYSKALVYFEKTKKSTIIELYSIIVEMGAVCCGLFGEGTFAAYRTRLNYAWKIDFDANRAFH